MKRSLVLVAFVLFASALALAEKPSLPKGLPLEGEPVAYLHFDDVTGSHVVVVTETKVTRKASPDGDEMSTKQLFGYQFSRQNEGWRQLWRTQDFVRDCPVDLTLSFVTGSLGVSDVDEDGVKETRFAYRLGCRGDVSPLGLKLLFHEGKQKLAVRGTTREQVGEDDDGKPVHEGGEHTLDVSFAKAPKGLKALALGEWRRLTGQKGSEAP